MHVLFLNFERSWRGGEQQIYHLAEYIEEKGGKAFIAYPKGEALRRFQKRFDCLELGKWPIRKLKKFCEENKIEIVDANSSKAHTYAIFVKYFLPQLKLVVHRRIDKQVQWKNHWKYHSSLVDAYVCISSAVKKNLAVSGIDSSKLHIVASGRKFFAKKESRTEYAEKWSLDANKIWVGIAAAFTAEKGHADFLQVASKVLEKSDQYQFLLAGSGPLEKKFLQYENQNIRFLGYQEDIASFMSAIDIYFMPSQKEGLGTAFLDAILGEAVLVGSNTGGIPDIIEDGHTGYLVNKNDIDTAVKIILNYNAAEAEIIRQNAMRKFQKCFSLDAMCEGNYQVFSAVLSGKQP
tara:strand:- start:26595 stop:27641 length:1047 start_codon:yes stop_codon:yes gene_type:complete